MAGVFLFMRPGSRPSKLAATLAFLLAVVAAWETQTQADSPSPEQLRAVDTLTHTGDWSVQWDEETGSPRTIMELRLSVGGAYRRPRPFDPEALAVAFFRANAGLFSLRPGRDSLVVREVEEPPPQARRKGGSTIRVRTEQLYMGVPVEYGGYVITMSRDGKVLFVNGRFYRGIDLDVRPALGAAECGRIAIQEVGAGADSIEPPVRLVVRRGEDRDHLVWSVPVTEDWAHVWVVLVDAHDGRVISRSNRIIMDPR